MDFSSKAKLILVVASIILVAIGIYFVYSISKITVDTGLQKEVGKTRFEEENLVLVTRVIDGDTIELESGEIVRYIGVNAPEIGKTNKCFAIEALSRNRELVQGKYVRLEKDISDKDKYERLLRYVYLEDDTFVNSTLVSGGYAVIATYSPDLKYQNLLLNAEREARSANFGLWSANTCNGDINK